MGAVLEVDDLGGGVEVLAQAAREVGNCPLLASLEAQEELDALRHRLAGVEAVPLEVGDDLQPQVRRIDALPLEVVRLDDVLLDNQ